MAYARWKMPLTFQCYRLTATTSKWTFWRDIERKLKLFQIMNGLSTFICCLIWPTTWVMPVTLQVVLSKYTVDTILRLKALYKYFEATIHLATVIVFVRVVSNFAQDAAPRNIELLKYFSTQFERFTEHVFSHYWHTRGAEYRAFVVASEIIKHLYARYRNLPLVAWLHFSSAPAK